MRIRDATLDDIPALVDLGRLFHEESCYRDTEFDPVKSANFGIAFIDQPATKFLKIAEDDKTGIYGMYVGEIIDYYFGNALVSVDYLFYIRPEKRGGLAASALIKEFEKWSFKNGVVEVLPMSSTNINQKLVQGLYERLGYQTIGQVFSKRR